MLRQYSLVTVRIRHLSRWPRETKGFTTKIRHIFEYPGIDENTHGREKFTDVNWDILRPQNLLALSLVYIYIYFDCSEEDLEAASWSEQPGHHHTHRLASYPRNIMGKKTLHSLLFHYLQQVAQGAHCTAFCTAAAATACRFIEHFNGQIG